MAPRIHGPSFSRFSTRSPKGCGFSQELCLGSSLLASGLPLAESLITLQNGKNISDPHDQVGGLTLCFPVESYLVLHSV